MSDMHKALDGSSAIASFTVLVSPCCACGLCERIGRLAAPSRPRVDRGWDRRRAEGHQRENRIASHFVVSNRGIRLTQCSASTIKAKATQGCPVCYKKREGQRT